MISLERAAAIFQAPYHAIVLAAKNFLPHFCTAPQKFAQQLD
jgi:hypothetical protein